MEWCYPRAGLCRVYGERQAGVDCAVYSPQVRAPESRIPPGDVSCWSFVQALEECRRPGELTWRCFSIYIWLCHVTGSEIWKHIEAVSLHLLTENTVYEYLCNSRVWVFLHDTAHCLLACPFFNMNSSTKITIWNAPLTSLVTGPTFLGSEFTQLSRNFVCLKNGFCECMCACVRACVRACVFAQTCVSAHQYFTTVNVSMQNFARIDSEICIFVYYFREFSW